MRTRHAWDREQCRCKAVRSRDIVLPICSATAPKQAQVVEQTDADAGGLKAASATVAGRGAYGALRFESGTHRVQRVPATESSGRVHTSAASVAVLLQPEEVGLWGPYSLPLSCALHACTRCCCSPRRWGEEGIFVALRRVSCMHVFTRSLSLLVYVTAFSGAHPPGHATICGIGCLEPAPLGCEPVSERE